MVSLETFQAMPKSGDSNSSPRISFSGEYLDEKCLISMSPRSPNEIERNRKPRSGEFEFLSSNVTSQTMLSADELFFEGKLLPFWQVQNSEKLEKICLKEKEEEEKKEVKQTHKETATRVTTWYVDDDPSPRPPKCTVLWKELMRLRKQRPSSLSPSSSSSSSSSSCSFGGDLPPIAEGREGSGGNREKHAKRMKKGLERTRSTSIKIRPMVNVPICTQGKNNSQLPPLFTVKKGRLDR
ncbi:hypothetical protein Vadar_032757 [Vaccinium darrowii]|uniref:Uncharacterized protein n=1 Tax=Vaccinium darrowii TaxID=229202 RepID=A0ACB7XWP6_9ERIC|nr:hypothetical protein Vadar_032757 [Vaccinium darrowii]